MDDAATETLETSEELDNADEVVSEDEEEEECVVPDRPPSARARHPTLGIRVGSLEISQTRAPEGQRAATRGPPAEGEWMAAVGEGWEE